MLLMHVTVSVMETVEFGAKTSATMRPLLKFNDKLLTLSEL